MSVGFSPDWVADDRDKVGQLFFDSGGESSKVNITGYEFRVGVVRGRELGGDWAVSFFRRKVDDGSTLGEVQTTCQTFTFVTPAKTRRSLEGTKNVYRGASLMGLEVNKFIAFATIHKRVQIGLNLGIGIGQWHGVADRSEYNAFFFPPFPPGGVILDPNSPVHSVVDAKDLYSMKNVATGKIQFSVAVILPKSFKIRMDTGYTIPGLMLFSITGNYLFGHR